MEGRKVDTKTLETIGWFFIFLGSMLHLIGSYILRQIKD